MNGDEQNKNVKITLSGQSRGEITAKEILLDIAFTQKNISEELRILLIKGALS